jgi:hypothetical protein
MATSEVAGLSIGTVPRAEVNANFRTGWLRHLGVAIGGASGMALALGAYEVFRTQPDKSFQLLQVWGPAFLVALLAIVVFGKLAENFVGGMIAAIRESFKMVATSVHDSAEATSRQADALTRLADQGGKQAEEVKMLALYAAQEFPGVYRRFDRQDQTLAEMGTSLRDLTTSIGTLTALHDLAIAMKDLIPGRNKDVE